WADAEGFLARAWQKKQSYDIAANLGIAETALRKFRSAAGHLDFALRTFPGNGKPENRALIQETFEKARAEVGALRIRVSVEGAQVFVDGEKVGLAPIDHAVYVDAGQHQVEAALVGYGRAQQSIPASKGGVVDVSLTLIRAEGSASSPS